MTQQECLDILTSILNEHIYELIRCYELDDLCALQQILISALESTELHS